MATLNITKAQAALVEWALEAMVDMFEVDGPECYGYTAAELPVLRGRVLTLVSPYAAWDLWYRAVVQMGDMQEDNGRPNVTGRRLGAAIEAAFSRHRFTELGLDP